MSASSKTSQPNRHCPMFEEFFIIGVDKEDILAEKTWGKTDRKRFNPKNLYMHIKGNATGDEECERRRVVKDFCFPDGIEVK